MSRGLVFVATLLAGLAFVNAAGARTFSDPPRMVEVVVTLDAPPLAQASLSGRKLAYAGGRLNVGSSRVDLQACKLEYSIVSPK